MAEPHDKLLNPYSDENERADDEPLDFGPLTDPVILFADEDAETLADLKMDWGTDVVVNLVMRGDRKPLASMRYLPTT